MNGDLISRKAVIELIEGCHVLEDAYCLVDYINELPTAYDVDKVMERLEEYAHSNICNSHNGCPYRDNEDMNCENCGAMGAVEIVKSGGIDKGNES